MPISLLTILWSMMAAACLTLSGIHFIIWWRGKSTQRHLLFVLAAIGAAATAFTELIGFKTNDPELYRLAVRAQHVPLYVMLVSIVWYLYVHLGTARKSLAFLFTGLWTIALVLNFVSSHSLVFYEVAQFDLLTVPWGEGFYFPANAVVNPLKIFADVASLVLIVYVLDATIRSWRRGDRQRAIIVGGSVLFFISFAGILIPFVDQGLVQIPSMISVAFMVIILAFGYELGIEAYRSAELSKEIVANERRWRTLLEEVQLIVVEVDVAGNVSYVNPFYTSLTGYSRDEVVGKNWIENFLPDNEKVPVNNALKELLNKKQYPHGDNRILTKDGERFIAWSNVTLLDAGENAVGIIGVGADITEREAAVDEIRQLKEKLEEENIYLKEEIILDFNYSEIIGHSDTLKYALKRVEQVAGLDTTVLIEGETGVGKELFARAVHHQSKRQKRPWIKINCAAIPANLIESELFGHEKGAFTGADRNRKGRFEIADKGTLFLDEIGELPFELQPKLFRVLEDGEFERIGSGVTIKVDVRVIAATNRVLTEEVKKGTFREDLYYRLSAFPISVAPLRQRKSDIKPLVQHFVERYSRQMGKKIETIPQHALDKLMSYSWPGNVRELGNVIERAVIATEDSKLKIIDKLDSQENGVNENIITLDDAERQHIVKALAACQWKIEGSDGAAQILDIHPNTLRNRLKKLGIERPQ